MINHRHLRTFVAIADYGSFVAAADRLGLTQSAVTMQMKALEHDLNATVFDRSRRSHKLMIWAIRCLRRRSTFTNALFEQLKIAEQTKDQPLSRIVK